MKKILVTATAAATLALFAGPINASGIQSTIVMEGEVLAPKRTVIPDWCLHPDMRWMRECDEEPKTKVKKKKKEEKEKKKKKKKKWVNKCQANNKCNDDKNKHKPKTRPADDEPVKKNEDKQNASANDGKWGNYDKTGHKDNGKGNGRNK